jgi:hypothetical protein
MHTECYSSGWPECCDDDQSESDENNNTTDENVSSSSSSSCPNNEIPECDQLLTWSSSSSSRSRSTIDIKNVESIVFVVIVVTGVIVNFIAN